MDEKKVNDNLIKNIYLCGKLKILIRAFSIQNINIKSLYEKIKTLHKSINIVILKPELVFGLEHIIGIIRVLYEELERDQDKRNNLDIEFLLRICYTNQIKYALDIINDENDNDFNGHVVCILFSKSLDLLMDGYNDLIKLGKDQDPTNLIEISESKRSFIVEKFFKKESKFLENNDILKNNGDFQKFLIERAAIALK